MYKRVLILLALSGCLQTNTDVQDTNQEWSKWEFSLDNIEASSKIYSILFEFEAPANIHYNLAGNISLGGRGSDCLTVAAVAPSASDVHWMSLGSALNDLPAYRPLPIVAGEPLLHESGLRDPPLDYPISVNHTAQFENTTSLRVDVLARHGLILAGQHYSIPWAGHDFDNFLNLTIHSDKAGNYSILQGGAFACESGLRYLGSPQFSDSPAKTGVVIDTFESMVAQNGSTLFFQSWNPDSNGDMHIVTPNENRNIYAGKQLIIHSEEGVGALGIYVESTQGRSREAPWLIADSYWPNPFVNILDGRDGLGQ